MTVAWKAAWRSVVKGVEVLWNGGCDGTKDQCAGVVEFWVAPGGLNDLRRGGGGSGGCG